MKPRGAPERTTSLKALPEDELKFVVPTGRRAASSQCSAARAIEDDRDRGGVDVEQNHTRLAQAVRGPYPAPAVDSSAELFVDCHI